MPYTLEEVAGSIIWSADVPDVHELLVRLEDMPKLKWVKIDRLFVARNGYDVFRILRERGLKSFYDAKIIEVPSKMEDLAKSEGRHGPTMLNCMAGGASGGTVLSSDDRDQVEALKRFADACHDQGIQPCAVTVLTSKRPEFVEREFGRNSIEQVVWYLHLLQSCGFTDAVCSPHEAATIREFAAFDDISLNTPGVRRATSSNQDQARVSTPAGALKAGANRLVIGRDLTRGNPAQNFDDIVTEIVADLV